MKKDRNPNNMSDRDKENMFKKLNAQLRREGKEDKDRRKNIREEKRRRREENSIDVNIDKVVYLRLGKYSIADLFIISQKNNVLFEIVLFAISNNKKSVCVDTSNQNMIMVDGNFNGIKYKVSLEDSRKIFSMKPLTLQKIEPTREVLERYLYFMDNYKEYITNDIENFEEKFRNKHFDNLIIKIRKDITRDSNKVKYTNFNEFKKFEIDEKDICLN
jgi:hypothetical protein